MDFINNTQFPALSFEGIDQLDQSFHVVVMRQTYTWNDKGLLILADEQDPLCMEDVLVNRDDLMSGVIEESDLCHYKPNCDVLIIGSAYAPSHADQQFTASLKVQTPDKVLYTQPIKASKYLFADTLQPKKKISQTLSGTVLIQKTLTITAPSVAIRQVEGITGKLRYQIKPQPMPHKVSLNPSSSFGGYCVIEEHNPGLSEIPNEEQIPADDRVGIRLNPQHGVLGYFSQDNHNPYGKGYMSLAYAKAIQPDSIELPQIYHPDHPLQAYHIDSLANGKLDAQTHRSLVQGFGIRAKSHPERHQYLGKIDQAFIDSDSYIPEGFDFAIWNCAYPDQQTEKLVGNEWLTLINLCHPQITAAHTDRQGNVQLRLYLPETLAYLVTKSNNPEYPESEVPMKLDTVIIRPDEQKVHLVWRGIIAGEYDPNVILLDTADRAKQQAILAQSFTQKGDIIRPYEEV